jgi:hypothetical protein
MIKSRRRLIAIHLIEENESFPLVGGRHQPPLVRAPRRDLKTKTKGLSEFGIWKAARETGPGREVKGREYVGPPPCPEIGLGVGPDYPEVMGMASVPPVEWPDDDLSYAPGYCLDEDFLPFDDKDDLYVRSHDFEFCRFD